MVQQSGAPQAPPKSPFELSLEILPSITLGVIASDVRGLITAHQLKLRKSGSSMDGVDDAIRFWQTALNQIEHEARCRDRQRQ